MSYAKHDSRYAERFHEPHYITLQRDGVCKLCCKTIEKRTEKVIRLETTHRSCQLLILCKDCVEKLYNLTQEKYVDSS